MDLRRLHTGEWMAAAAGVALLVSLFLPWYGPESVSAWQSLAAIDILLAFVAATGLLLAIVTATQRVPAVPIALSAFVTLSGLIGIVLVVIRVVDLPDGASGREWALWLGLAGTIGIAAGAALAMEDERLSPPGRHTDLTGRPVPPPSEPDSIPAPRP
jgi:hypothetical protein